MSQLPNLPRVDVHYNQQIRRDEDRHYRGGESPKQSVHLRDAHASASSLFGGAQLFVQFVVGPVRFVCHGFYFPVAKLGPADDSTNTTANSVQLAEVVKPFTKWRFRWSSLDPFLSLSKGRDPGSRWSSPLSVIEPVSGGRARRDPRRSRKYTRTMTVRDKSRRSSAAPSHSGEPTSGSCPQSRSQLSISNLFSSPPQVGKTSPPIVGNYEQSRCGLGK